MKGEFCNNAEVIAQALRNVIADQCGARACRAVGDLLSRAAPHLSTGPRPDLLDGADAVAGTIAAVSAMNGTVLPIQGPPRHLQDLCDRPGDPHTGAPDTVSGSRGTAMKPFATC